MATKFHLEHIGVFKNRVYPEFIFADRKKTF